MTAPPNDHLHLPSPLFDGKELIALSKTGDVVILQTDEKAFISIRKSKLGDGFKASSATTGGHLILRSSPTLYSIAPVAT